MAGATQASRARKPSNRWRLDALLVTFMAYTMVLVYDQLARPFCLGLPNTLPLKGLASSGFPCGSSLARRAVFLSSRPVAVYWDYLRLHTPDLWVSASAAIMLLRVGVVLLAPSTLRHRWVCAAHRLLTPVTLLLQLVVSPGPSPAGTPLLYGASPHAMGAAAQLCAGGLPCATSPSMLSTWFARVYPLLDAMYTIIFPTSFRIEAAYGAASFVTSVLLGWQLTQIQQQQQHEREQQSQKHQPAGGVAPYPLALQLFICAASTSWILYLHWHRERAAAANRWEPRSGGSSAGQGPSGSGAVQDCAPGCEEDASAKQGVVPRRNTRWGAVGGLFRRRRPGAPCSAREGMQQGPGDTAAELEAAGAAPRWTAGGQPAVLQDDAGGAMPAGGAQAPVNGHVAEARVAPWGVPPAGASAQRHSPLSAVAAAHQLASYQPFQRNRGQQPAVLQQQQQQQGPGLPQHRLLMSYRPCVRLVSTHIKIHGAEPEDVTPGFEQRLAEAIAAQGRGMELEAVYLRRGCIELVLDIRCGGPAGARDYRTQELGQQLGGQEGLPHGRQAGGAGHGMPAHRAGASSEPGGRRYRVEVAVFDQLADRSLYENGQGLCGTYLEGVYNADGWQFSASGSGGLAAAVYDNESVVDVGAAIRALGLPQSGSDSSAVVSTESDREGAHGDGYGSSNARRDAGGECVGCSSGGGVGGSDGGGGGGGGRGSDDAGDVGGGGGVGSRCRQCLLHQYTRQQRQEVAGGDAWRTSGTAFADLLQMHLEAQRHQRKGHGLGPAGAGYGPGEEPQQQQEQQQQGHVQGLPQGQQQEQQREAGRRVEVQHTPVAPSDQPYTWSTSCASSAEEEPTTQLTAADHSAANAARMHGDAAAAAAAAAAADAAGIAAAEGCAYDHHQDAPQVQQQQQGVSWSAYAGVAAGMLQHQVRPHGPAVSCAAAPGPAGHRCSSAHQLPATCGYRRSATGCGHPAHAHAHARARCVGPGVCVHADGAGGMAPGAGPWPQLLRVHPRVLLVPPPAPHPRCSADEASGGAGGCGEQQHMLAAGADDWAARQGVAGAVLEAELLWPATGDSLEYTNAVFADASDALGAGTGTVATGPGCAAVFVACSQPPSTTSYSSASSCGPAASGSSASVSSSFNATVASSSAADSCSNSVACGSAALVQSAATTKGTSSTNTGSNATSSGGTASGTTSSRSSGKTGVPTSPGLAYHAAPTAVATVMDSAASHGSAPEAAAVPDGSCAGGSHRRLRAPVASVCDAAPQGGTGAWATTCRSAANTHATLSHIPTSGTSTTAAVTATTSSRTACWHPGPAVPLPSSLAGVDPAGVRPPQQRSPRPVELRAYCRTTGAVPISLHAQFPHSLGPDPTAMATASSYSACTAVRYCASLPYLPRCPGLLVLELLGASLASEHVDPTEPVPASGPESPCGSGAAVAIAVVPVVLVADERTARELQAVVDGWCGCQRELNELLFDVGVLLGEAAEAAEAAEAGRLPDSRLLRLAAHLRAHALAAGWAALAAAAGAVLQAAGAHTA